MSANPLRGEVDLEIHGEKYVLRRSYGGMAKFQQAINKEGLPSLWQMIIERDMRAMLYGPVCLAISGDIRKIEDMDADSETTNKISLALQKLLIGNPEKNADSATAESPK